MPDLVEIVKSKIAPDVPQLAKWAELTPTETRTALDAVIPALLYGAATTGATSAGATQITQFAREQQGVTSLSEHLTSEAASTKLSSVGSRILPALYGDNLGRTIECVATSAGIRYNSAAALMHLVAPFVMGVAGGEARRLGLDATGLTKTLGDQRAAIYDAAPPELAKCLGLERPQVVVPPVRAVAPVAAVAAVPPPEPVRAPVYTEPVRVVEPVPQKTTWWPWLLLPLGLLALLGIWGWQANQPAAPVVAPVIPSPARTIAVPTVAVPTAVLPTVAAAAPTAAAAIATAAAPPAVPAAAAVTTLQAAGTMWVWERLERPNAAEVRPGNPRDYTLRFAAPGDGRYGDTDIRADCNAGRGIYQQQPANLMSFDAAGVPRSSCATGSLSNEFLARLGEVSNYTIRDGRLFLTLRENLGTLELAPVPAQ